MQIERIKLTEKIAEIMTYVDDLKIDAGRSEQGRLLAIIATHLETAHLYSNKLEK